MNLHMCMHAGDSCKPLFGLYYVWCAWRVMQFETHIMWAVDAHWLCCLLLWQWRHVVYTLPLSDWCLILHSWENDCHKCCVGWMRQWHCWVPECTPNSSVCHYMCFHDCGCCCVHVDAAALLLRCKTGIVIVNVAVMSKFLLMLMHESQCWCCFV